MEDESEEKSEQIDTSSKRKTGRRGVSRTEKKPLKVPKVGSKRTRVRKGDSDDEDEEEDSNEDDGVVKKRKVSKGKA